MANYEVDPELLKPHLPFGTELDDFEGKYYVSLVGFLFRDTRVLGVRMPFHVNFEEFNLRFYVRYQDQGVWKRGVVFISEIVPKPAITWVANLLYNEHYTHLPMRHHYAVSPDQKLIQYEWKHKGSWQMIRANTSLSTHSLVSGSVEEFITEHYWGYSKLTETSTNEYEVVHPRWELREVLSYELQCKAASLYGPAFAWLESATPDSFLAAVGSEVKVMGRKVIR